MCASCGAKITHFPQTPNPIRPHAEKTPHRNHHLRKHLRHPIPSSDHFRKLLHHPHFVLRPPLRLRTRHLRVCPSALQRALHPVIQPPPKALTPTPSRHPATSPSPHTPPPCMPVRASARIPCRPPFTYPLSHNTRSPALPSGQSLAIPFLRHRLRMYPHATLSPASETSATIFKKF